MAKFKKSQRGSATVEAAILVPVVILSIIVVIQIGIFLCGRSTMQAAADNASEAGSAGWRHYRADIETSKVYAGDLDDDGIYWRIADGYKSLKKEKVVGAASSCCFGQLAAVPAEKQAEADMTDFVVYKMLSVSLKQDYRVPAAGLLHIFGFTDRLSFRVTSLSVVNDPAELIRNTDFAGDLEKKLEESNPGLKDIGDKTRGVIQKLKEKMESLDKP